MDRVARMVIPVRPAEVRIRRSITMIFHLALRRSMKMKYRSKKVKVDGISFHSKKEATRYKELKQLERAGEISDLRLQVKYVLIPAQGTIVEDTKGFRTKEYIIKRKLMLYIHGIRIREV